MLQEAFVRKCTAERHTCYKRRLCARILQSGTHVTKGVCAQKYCRAAHMLQEVFLRKSTAERYTCYKRLLCARVLQSGTHVTRGVCAQKYCRASHMLQEAFVRKSTAERYTCYKRRVRARVLQRGGHIACELQYCRVVRMLYGHLRLTVLHSGTHILWEYMFCSIVERFICSIDMCVPQNRAACRSWKKINFVAPHTICQSQISRFTRQLGDKTRLLSKCAHKQNNWSLCFRHNITCFKCCSVEDLSSLFCLLLYWVSVCSGKLLFHGRCVRLLLFGTENSLSEDVSVSIHRPQDAETLRTLSWMTKDRYPGKIFLFVSTPDR